MPAGADVGAIIAVLGDRAVDADPALAAALDLRRGAAVDLPRLEVSSHPPRKLAVVAASERALGPLVATAARSGWRTAGASTEQMDPLSMSRMLLDASVDAVLVGAGDPPAADERRALGELAALVAGVAERRPELIVVLAGGMSEHLPAFGDVGRRPGEVVLGPAARRGAPGGPLADLLIELALPPDDAHRALGWGAMALADVLDRRVDVVEIGYDAGTRAAATPGVGGIRGDGPAGRRPERGTRARGPRRRGRRPCRAVVDLGRRPPSPPRPTARAAHRTVGRRDRRRRHASPRGRPGRPLAPGRVDARLGRPAARRPDRRHRWRVGRRRRPDHRARARGRAAPTRGGPVRARSRADPRAARARSPTPTSGGRWSPTSWTTCSHRSGRS